MLPRTFLQLPEAFARKMYPSEYRPDVIRTSPSMTYQEVLDCVVGLDDGNAESIQPYMVA